MVTKEDLITLRREMLMAAQERDALCVMNVCGKTCEELVGIDLVTYAARERVAETSRAYHMALAEFKRQT